MKKQRKSISHLKLLCEQIQIWIIAFVPQEVFELPQFVRTVQKCPYVGILSFKRSGAALAAPLLFLSGCARGYRNEYICQSDHSLL